MIRLATGSRRTQVVQIPVCGLCMSTSPGDNVCLVLSRTYTQHAEEKCCIVIKSARRLAAWCIVYLGRNEQAVMCLGSFCKCEHQARVVLLDPASRVRRFVVPQLSQAPAPGHLDGSAGRCHLPPRDAGKSSVITKISYFRKLSSQLMLHLRHVNTILLISSLWLVLSDYWGPIIGTQQTKHKIQNIANLFAK